MEKNKVKALCVSFLLTLSTTLTPCITSYGLGGDSVELCIEDNKPETHFSLYDENEDTTWMELFQEGEENYEE